MFSARCVVLCGYSRLDLGVVAGNKQREYTKTHNDFCTVYNRPGLLDNLANEFEPFDFRKSEQLRCQVTEHPLSVRASAVRQTFS